jgi:ArsR family transcriptional regulator, lead/cadmium/zinc/bismuth-responsive transcriptional repressor
LVEDAQADGRAASVHLPRRLAAGALFGPLMGRARLHTVHLVRLTRRADGSTLVETSYAGGVADERCDLLCLDLAKAEILRAERLDVGSAKAIAVRAKALADPTRLMVTAALAATDELCVCDLSWVCERSENLVSHHLRLLRSAGLVTSRRDGKMVMYSVTDQGRDLLTTLGVGTQVGR